VSDWIHSLPIMWMAMVFFGLAYLVASAIWVLVHVLATRLHAHARSFSSGMLSPLGTLFALFVVFTAAQVWTDNDHAHAAVTQEASALREAVILSAAYPGEPQQHITTLVRSHIEDAVSTEWPMMTHRTGTLNVPQSLASALQYTLSLKPSGQGQEIAQRQMAEALESALDARRQRILISNSAVSSVKWTCVVIEGLCLLLAVALVHCDNRLASALSLFLLATGAGACLLVIAAYDRPFTGRLAVSAEPLMQVMPEASQGAP
jgi:hypothetical protein